MRKKRLSPIFIAIERSFIAAKRIAFCLCLKLAKGTAQKASTATITASIITNSLYSEYPIAAETGLKNSATAMMKSVEVAAREVRIVP